MFKAIQRQVRSYNCHDLTAEIGVLDDISESLLSAEKGCSESIKSKNFLERKLDNVFQLLSFFHVLDVTLE